MKKTLAILLTLALLCGMSALAELGSADVAMNGNQYHISLESVEIKDHRERAGGKPRRRGRGLRLGELERLLIGRQ